MVNYNKSRTPKHNTPLQVRLTGNIMTRLLTGMVKIVCLLDWFEEVSSKPSTCIYLDKKIIKKLNPCTSQYRDK